MGGLCKTRFVKFYLHYNNTYDKIAKIKHIEEESRLILNVTESRRC